MPYLENGFYIETDLSDRDYYDISYTTKRVIELFQGMDQSEVAQALPLVSQLEERLKELDEAHIATFRPGAGLMAYNGIKSATKAVCQLLVEVGRHVADLVRLGKVGKWTQPFPAIYTIGMRRPTNVATFKASYDVKQGRWELKCSKHPAVLLFFNWDVSEDGGQTWVNLGTGRSPVFTTRKLDPPGKPYVFRLIMTNPGGDSDPHYCNREHGTVPLAHTPLPQRSSSGRRKKRGRKRRR